MTIWKYQADAVENVLEVPHGATFLSAIVQRGRVVVYASVNPGARMTKRIVRLVGTGAPDADVSGKFLGTVELGAFVFHVFDGGDE